MYIKIFPLAFFVFITSSVFSQVNPPAMAMPEKGDITIIDSIIKITNHEAFFIEYCTKRVKEYAELNRWDKSKTLKILKGIKFKYYDDTIYNSYADYSSTELKSLLDVLIALNKKSKDWSRMILTNSMMQNNLDVFVSGLVEGKYVMSSD